MTVAERILQRHYQMPGQMIALQDQSGITLGEYITPVGTTMRVDIVGYPTGIKAVATPSRAAGVITRYAYVATINGKSITINPETPSQTGKLHSWAINDLIAPCKVATSN